jgi:hypothetical protein
MLCKNREGGSSSTQFVSVCVSVSVCVYTNQLNNKPHSFATSLVHVGQSSEL